MRNKDIFIENRDEGYLGVEGKNCYSSLGLDRY